MKILRKEEAKKIVSEALDCAFDAVSHTLGPKGTNAVIVLNGKTTITNDGVSIIKQLELSEEYNIPLNIIKEACFNTENKSGDGTTTSIILTKAIFDKGKTFINKGINPIFLRNKIFKDFNEYEKIIKNHKKNIETINDIKNVATISIGGDEELGEIVSEAFSKVNLTGTINYQLDPASETITLDKIKGYNINCTYVGYQEFPKEELHDVDIIIYEGKISTIADLHELARYNREVNKLKPIILISNFENDALNGLLYYSNAGNRIYPFSISRFGKNREIMIAETNFLTNGADFNKETPFINFEIEDFKDGAGNIKTCILKQDALVLTKTDEEKLAALLLDLEKRGNFERKQEIENGICTILVGGKTEIEAKETLLRIEDAVNSVRSAIRNGITIGGANLLFKISDNVENSVLSEALKLPLKVILFNNGEDIENEVFKNILPEILKDNDIGYNAKYDRVENLIEHGVIDPLETVLNSLKSAVSIATSLLTINCIITENKKNGGF